MPDPDPVNTDSAAPPASELPTALLRGVFVHDIPADCYGWAFRQGFDAFHWNVAYDGGHCSSEYVGDLEVVSHDDNDPALMETLIRQAAEAREGVTHT